MHGLVWSILVAGCAQRGALTVVSFRGATVATHHPLRLNPRRVPQEEPLAARKRAAVVEEQRVLVTPATSVRPGGEVTVTGADALRRFFAIER